MKKVFILCCLAMFCVGTTLGCSKPAGTDDKAGEAPASTTAAK